MRLNFYLLLLFSICFFRAQAQDNFIPLNDEMNVRYDEWLAHKDVGFIPTIRSYRSDELRAYIPYDSLETDISKNYYPRSQKATHSWLSHILFSEHLIEINDTADKFHFTVDPLMNFQLGHNKIIDAAPGAPTASENTFTNTRGFMIQGTIGKNFLFYSNFYENQASFPYYVDSTIRQTGFVPGQGLVKGFTGYSYGSNAVAYDFEMANAGVSYSIKHINFTFATDKNFLGDGYRSLFLSDNSFAYPFLRITADIWRLRYVTITAEMQDAQAPHPQDAGFRKKYASFHYLLFGIGKNNRLTLGLFESIIWAYDTVSARGFDAAYLNPVIFYKPVEESLDDPDKSKIGFSARYKLLDGLTLYGQFVLDEFSLDQVVNRTGWWANKQGVQVGFKSFNVAGVKHLSLQSEFNYVRPYTYSAVASGTDYAQSNQALADPLGANFMESVSFLRYNYKRWYVQAELMAAVAGLDTGGLDYGSNILTPYLDYVSEYGNFVGQGLKTTIMHKTLQFSYLVNPAYNMRLELGVDDRTTSNSLGKTNAVYITFGLKTSILNTYYDY